MKIIFWFIVSYLIGSFPTAYLLVKRFKGQDIRNFGSGNPGATNVLRSFGVFLGVLTLIVDLLKGYLPVFLTKIYFKESIIPFVVLFSILGHMFSLFIGFKGGKGVATFFGAILGLSFELFLMCATIFIFVLLLTKYVSLSSIVSLVFFIIFIFFRKTYTTFSYIIWFFITVLIIYRHKDNIKRIIKNQENKIF